MDEIRIKVTGVEKSFPGVKALTNINFSVRKGSVHVICGENGAGKSTLMKIINGVYKPDTGSIFIDGHSVNINNPINAREYGISMIFQELNYIPEMTIEESLFVGRLPLNRFKKVDWKRVRKETLELLHTEDLKYSPTTKMKELSISDIQMLEILKAISYKSQIIIMDEPTSAITEKEVTRLFEKIRELRKRGASIIYISHKMDEIFQIADEITVLRDGELVETRDKDEISIDEVISLMVGRELSDEFPKRERDIGKVVFKAEDLMRPGYFENINFEIHQGEIVGFAGLMGAGRTEVMRAIFGLDPLSKGILIKEGVEIPSGSVQSSIANGIVMLSEDRRRYGIVPIRSVRENLTLANLKKYFYRGHLHTKDELNDVQYMCTKIAVKTPNFETPIDSLSGGNQQKVILAKWMINNPDILIMDEPTRGIDVGAKYEIYKLMTAFVNEGKSIIIVSSELPELLGMCDRIYVMSKGQINGELNRDEFSQEAIMKLAANVELKEGDI